MRTRIPVITIDGPTASGKGTIATRVAQALGWHVLDSGALYRAAALVIVEQSIDADDVHVVAAAAGAMQLVFAAERITLSGRDISAAIRREDVGTLASRIAAQAPLRAALLALQRNFRQTPGLVADGRDMGTVVFPDAALKIFLQADVQTRAERRYKQLKEKGVSVKLSDLAEGLQQRDQRDMTRENAPLVAAADAKIVDSSTLTVDETVNVVLDHWSNLGWA